MAQYQITLNSELLQQLFLSDAKDAGVAKLLESVLNQVLQAQATEQLCAEHYERTEERQGYRNGTYPHTLVTREVNFVVSDDHGGLVKAVKQNFQGTTWQRCQTHFMWNVLDATPKSLQQEIYMHVRAILDAPEPGTAQLLLNQTLEAYSCKAPKAMSILEAGFDDATSELYVFSQTVSQPYGLLVLYLWKLMRNGLKVKSILI